MGLVILQATLILHFKDDSPATFILSFLQVPLLFSYFLLNEDIICYVTSRISSSLHYDYLPWLSLLVCVRLGDHVGLGLRELLSQHPFTDGNGPPAARVSSNSLCGRSFGRGGLCIPVSVECFSSGLSIHEQTNKRTNK